MSRLGTLRQRVVGVDGGDRDLHPVFNELSDAKLPQRSEAAGLQQKYPELVMIFPNPLKLYVSDKAPTPGLRSEPLHRHRDGAALEAWRSLHAEGSALDRGRFQERILQRFLTAHPYASREDLAYLSERLDRPADTLHAPAHANAA